MNLKALRTNLKSLLDYSPELQAFNDQADELINEAYLHLWTARRWNFAQKQKLFKFYPDMTGSRDTQVPGTPVTASVLLSSRQVVFSAGMDRLTTEWEGQPIEIQGYEYTVNKVTSTSTILLKEQFHGTTNAADDSWKIKRRYYDLEPDCMELLSLSHRDTPVAGNGFPAYGKLIALLARREEEWNLRMDLTASYAEGFIWSAPNFIPPAEKTAIQNITQRETQTTAGFPVDTYLEVCWAFEKDGRVGALSEPATVTFPTGQNITYSFDIQFLSWDDQEIITDAFQALDRVPSQYEGYRKVVYWNANYNRTTGERLGLPCWIEFNTGGVNRNTQTYLNRVEAADTDGSVTIDWFNQIDSGNPRYIEYDGQHLRIRPYPRVDAYDVAVDHVTGDLGATYPDLDQDFLRYGVQRYQYKPPVLSKATDSPEMPYEFHQLIVYRALEQMYLKLGSAQMSDIYRRRIDDAIKVLEKRYLDRIDSDIRRGQFGVSSSRFFYDAETLAMLN